MSPPQLRSDDGELHLETDNSQWHPLSPVTPRFRVVGADGAPRCDWRTLPIYPGHGLVFNRGGRFVPGTTALAWVDSSPAGPPPACEAPLRKLLRLPPREPSFAVYWYDWAADDLRVACRTPLRPRDPGGVQIDVRTPPGRLAVLHCDSHGTGTVEIWDAPPPRLPWPWSVPAGVGVGVLLTALGVRLRRPGGRRGGPPIG